MQLEKIDAASKLEGEERNQLLHRYLNEIKRELLKFQDWHISAKIDFSGNRTSALRFECDPDRQMIEVSEVRSYSLDPADYPDHLSTTSELLWYVVASANLTIAFVGNINWFVNDFRLMKVVVRILDREGIDVGAIRTDVADSERWDYSNPDFEAEVLKPKPS
jgi:hypothetical protein